MKQDLLYYMQANDNDELSDGAWQAMLEDSVKAYNRNHKTNYDPFEMFMEYIQWVPATV